MSRDTLIRIVIPSVLYAAFGIWVAEKLAAHPGLLTYKVFNVVGCSMALLGMVVLSQLVVANERYKALILETVSQQVLAFLIFSGAALMLFSMHWAKGPSASSLEKFGPQYFFVFVLPSMVFFNIGINGVDRPLPWSDKTRYTAFGAYLAGGGMLLQLYAAVSDLMA